MRCWGLLPLVQTERPKLLPNFLPIPFRTPATQATQGTGLLLCDESVYIVHLQ